MYNFYRAWFGSEQSCPLETLSPPDTLIRVGNDGEHQFVAHRGILAAHSGYLKALLSNSGSSTSSERNSLITTVSVSSVGGEAFAPLLNYMYTGHLEVTLDNIYSVLLATHLLHMPGALEQCRAALLRLRAPPAIPVQQTGTGNVLRPVPNRLVGPPFCWPQTSLYSSGPILPRLPSLHLPPIIPPILQDPGSSLPYSTRERSVSPKSSTSRPLRSRSRSLTPIISQVQSSSHFRNSGGDPQIQQKIPRAPPTRSPTISESSEKITVTDVAQSFRHHRRRSRSNTDRGNESGGSVIYDVACCDGPVRFHRVLNENYSAPSSGTVIRPRSCVESEDNTSGENDENGRPEDVSEPSSGGVDCGVSGNYTCGYCQHTFKSQYCYRKHARRHLLPTEAESSRNLQRQQDKRRREVRLLDLNVQYYPCKICGSKFPSYYFVHKHRKLCHSNSEDDSRENFSQEEINEVNLANEINQVNQLNQVNQVNQVNDAGDSVEKQLV